MDEIQQRKIFKESPKKSMNFAHVEKFIHGLILTVIDNRLNKFKI